MWEKINKAIQNILDGDAKRIDGDGWLVYAVGSNVVRVDFKTDMLTQYFQSNPTA